jgi:hypothetical protein
MGKKESS